MGNQSNLCGAEPRIDQIISQLQTCPSHKTDPETVRFRTIEYIKQRPQFSKISPVIHINDDINEQEEEFQLQYTGQKTQNRQKSIEQHTGKVPQQQSQKENDQVYQYPKMMSLEELFEQEEQNLKKFQRIGVNWHSFIKIKKRSYLEDYLFVKQIGKGAYGSVLKVKMKYGGHLRAAKIIKSSLVTKDKSSKLFAQILVPMKLDHPNLVKLYEVFQHKGQYVLAMQLCQGGDLFTYIKQSRFFNEAKAGILIKQILSAVNYMHKQKVIHRDLKPENILVDPENQTLKIADFGTALFFNDDIKLTEFVGTAYYMAPEVINGSYDYKCDIWSCGIILYILLCGSPPFNGKNQKQIMQKIKIMPLQFKSAIWNKRNKQAKNLITKMLSKNPNERCTAQQALNSKWLSNLSNLDKQLKSSQVGIQKEVINNLQNFHFKNKLKAVVYTYIASQLYSTRDKQHLQSVFKAIDKDGDGVIQKDELITIFNTHSKSSLSQIEIQKILELVDTNGSGKIDFTQFLVAASNEEQLLQEKRLQSAFNYLDTDHSGFITMEEVRVFLDGSEETNDQIKQIFDEVDQNGDGTISKKQFISLLMKK